MALSKTPRTIVTSASNSAGGTTRGTLDLKTTYGGFLTIKMTTGGTGPSAQCVCNVMVAHNSTLPAAGSAGTDWKTIHSFGSGTAANVKTEEGLPIDTAIMALCIEFTGNTGQAVTVEAYFSELTSV